MTHSGASSLRLWQQEGVDASGVAIDADASTGIYFVTHGAGGHEFSYLRAGSAASRMRPSDLPLPVIRLDQSAACIGHQPGDQRRAPAIPCSPQSTRRAKPVHGSRSIRNVRPKLWPLPRARAVIAATMALCDWFLPSLDEAIQLCGNERPEAILDWCHAPGRADRRTEDGPPTASGCSTGDSREHVAGHARRRRSTRLGPATVSMAHSRRGSSQAIHRWRRLVTPTPRRRWPRPATAPSRRCRGTAR